MKRMVDTIIALTLITCMFALTAFASTKAEALGLKNYLQENFGSQPVFEGVENTMSEMFNLSYYLDEDDDGDRYVIICANGSGFDCAILDIANKKEDSHPGIILSTFMNAMGAMARLANQYGVSDTILVFQYKTDEDRVGTELCFSVGGRVDTDSVYIASDDIFGFESLKLSFSKDYGSNYYLDLSSSSEE